MPVGAAILRAGRRMHVEPVVIEFPHPDIVEQTRQGSLLGGRLIHFEDPGDGPAQTGYTERMRNEFRIAPVARLQQPTGQTAPGNAEAEAFPRRGTPAGRVVPKPPCATAGSASATTEADKSAAGPFKQHADRDHRLRPTPQIRPPDGSRSSSLRGGGTGTAASFMRAHAGV